MGNLSAPGKSREKKRDRLKNNKAAFDSRHDQPPDTLTGSAIRQDGNKDESVYFH